MPIRVVPAVTGVRRSTVSGSMTSSSSTVRLADARADAVVVEAWLRELARSRIDDAIERHAAGLGVTPRKVTVRDPRTRWGVPHRPGGIAVVAAGPGACEALETVVIHELAHLRIFGHGPGFWALVASRRPDHRTWRRWLHDHATELHGALG